MKHNVAKNARPSECEKGYRRWISPSNKVTKSKEPPPKPDPFDDVWNKAYPGNVGVMTKTTARFFWDAAIKHAKGE